MQNVQWEPIDTKKAPFKGLTFGEELSFDIIPQTERLRTWDQLFEATNTPMY